MTNLNEVKKIKEMLNFFNEDSDLCGFEGFVAMKTEPKLKRISFDERNMDDGNNYKKIIKRMIVDQIKEKYLSDSAEYASAEDIADNQNKFYIIPVTGDYSPFPYLDNDTEAYFECNDLKNPSGIFFCFTYEGQTVWAYQHLWNMMVSKKTRNNLLTRVMHFEDKDVFAEQKDPVLTITNKVDLLVVENNIVTSNISLMQSCFKFEDFIQAKAKESISKIKNIGIVQNQEKIEDYVSRRKRKYANKMMRITNSKVLELNAKELIEKINTSPRWRDKFNIVNDKIQLSSYDQVENLIDLFDERYTRSEITNQEYDTDVKKPTE